MKTETKQNRYNYECKRDKSLQSCFAHLIFSQFKKKFNE